MRARRLPRKPLTCLAAAALLAPLLTVSAGSPALSSVARYNVAVSGQFDAATTVGSVAGTTYPTFAGGSTPITAETTQFTFNASCTIATTSSTCVPSSVTVAWDFGDGFSQVVTGSLSVAHAYVSPGAYTVTARVSATDGSGQGSGTISALVSPRWADVDVHQGSVKPGRPERNAIWGASALGLMAPCRPALAALDTAVNVSSTDVLRGMFCPEPSTTYALNAVGALTMPASPGATLHGVTGVSCISRASACGLPAEYFLRAASGGDPTRSCDPACQAGLRALNRLDASNRVVYNPTNCADGYTANRTNGTWSVGIGVEPGCMSRGEFFTALTRQLDGSRAATAPTASTASCEDLVTAEQVAAARGVLRAVALLGPGPVVRTRSGAQCDAADAISKREAYIALQAATGLVATPTPACDNTTFADLVDATLGRGTATPDAACTTILHLLNSGVPMVGDTACPIAPAGSLPPRCFNPSAALTRAQAAQLLLSVVVGRSALVSQTTVEVDVTTQNTTAAGVFVQPARKPFPVQVTVTLPPYRAAGSSVTVTWPSAPAGGTIACPALAVGSSGSETKTVDANRQARFVCYYTVGTSTAGTPAQIVVGVNDGAATFNQTVQLITASNRAPVLGNDVTPSMVEASWPATSPTSWTMNINGFDADGHPLTFLVRSSCDNTGGSSGCTDVNDYAQATVAQSATTTWSTSANIGLGAVSITPMANAVQSAVVTITATGTYGSTAAHDTYGSFGFAVRACDSDGTCTVRAYTGAIQPGNDPGKEGLSTYAPDAPRDEFGKTTNFNLDCPDNRDRGRPGYPTLTNASVVPGQITPTAFTYRLTAVSGLNGAGDLQAYDGSTWVSLSNTAYSLLIPSAQMRFVSPPSGGPNTGILMTYDCIDTTYGTPSASTASAVTYRLDIN